MATPGHIPFGIKPFDGTNFSNWSFRIKLFLEQNHVLSVLDQEPPSDEALLKAYTQEDVKARNIIVQSLADNILPMVKDKRSAKLIMDTLATTYEKKGMKSLVTAQKTWRKMEYKNDRPLQDFLQDFESTAGEVRVAGGKLEEDELVNQLLVAMPSNFDSVVSAMDILFNKDRSALSLDYVKNTLLAEYERNIKKEDEHHSAFSSFKKKGKSNKFFNSKNTSGTSEKHSKVICYYCKRPGHIKNFCPKLKNKSLSASSNDKTSDKTEFLFTTSLVEDSNPLESAFVSDRSDRTFFVIDSGASCHLLRSDYKDYLQNESAVNLEISVAKAGVSVRACKKGDLLCLSDNGDTVNISDVLVCENLSFNLLSVLKLEEKGCKVVFEDSCVKIIFGNKVLKGQLQGKLYIIQFHLVRDQANTSELTNQLMHRRMGHSSVFPVGVCDICLKGKQTKLPFCKSIPDERKATRILQRISTDVCGKISPPTYNGYNYFVTFIDNFTNFCVTYLLHKKSEVFDKFKVYVTMVETKFQSRIENLRCDRGGEYISEEFRNFCKARGISVSYSMPRNPSQNGKSERMNRTLLEKVRCLLLDSNLEKDMWGEALMTATHLVNRLTTSTLPKGITPAECWYGFKPDLNKIKIFGCPAYSLIHKEDRKGKLCERSKRLFLVGYCDNGYRLWNPETRKVECARNVVFDEYAKTDLSTNQDSYHIIKSPENNDDGNSGSPKKEPEEPAVTSDTSVNSSDNENFLGFSDTDECEQTEFTSSTRIRRKPKYLNDFVTNFAFDLFALSAAADINVPSSFSEAITDVDWRFAINEELQSLEANKTWEVVDTPPQNTNIIDSRWVFTTKTNEGTVKKKARLVARGYQQPALDNENIYAPVARMMSLRVLLSLAAEKGLLIHQLDVRSAFLKSVLPTPVYMKPPEGLKCSDKSVLKVVKALYGLRQSPKAWNDHINSIFVNFSFVRSNVDPCLYYKEGTYVLIWVDDFLLVSDSEVELNIIKCQLMSKLDIKDLSSKSNLQFLGINIILSKTGIVLNQSGLIKKIICKFNMSDCKPSKIPIQPKLNLAKSDVCDTSLPYKELIGSLMYLMLGSRPDLCFSVSYFGRFQNCYSKIHWKHLKHIIRYLKYSENIGLNFTKSDCDKLSVHSFADADFAHDLNDRKSVSGFVIKLNNNVVHWSSKKQTVIALSSTESEFYALSCCLTESIFLCNLLKDIFKTDYLINVYEDNQSTIKIAQTLETKRSKHFDVKFHFVKDLVSQGNAKIHYIETSEQVADIMTKALHLSKFESFCNKLNLISLM